jgi:hypothetical protein
MIAIRTARTALTALAVSVSSFGMPAYAASNVGSAARADSTPAAPGDGHLLRWATPATACSSPAPSSPTRRRWRATISPPSPTSPPRSAPRRAPGGVSGFQIHLLEQDIFTPGDAPDVLDRDEPRGAQGHEPGRPAPGWHAHRQHRQVHPRPISRRRPTSPTRSTTAPWGYLVIPVKITTLTKDAVATSAWRAKASDRCKNFFALGIVYWLFNRDSSTPATTSGSKKFKSPTERQPRGAQGRLELRRDRRALPAQLRRAQGEAHPGHLPQHHRQRGPGLGPRHRHPEGGPRLFLGSYPITPASDILHSWRSTRNSASHLPGRGRDRRVCAAIGASYGGASASPPPPARARAQDRGHRPRRHDRAAAGRHRRAARRPRHGPAHQDRAGRPAAGDLRPQRRVPDAGDRGLHPVRLLRLRHRGRPHRREVHDPGDPALRRLHRQRRRALAHPRSGLAAHPSRSSSAPRPRASSPMRATPTWRAPGPCPARPAWSTASAASRRPTSPATSPTTR